MGTDQVPSPRRVKILLATLGSRGDVEPFLWLARAAIKAGHDVRVALPADVEQDVADLDAVSLGASFSDISQSAQRSGGLGIREFRDQIRPAMSRALATLVDAAMEWQPQVIVAHPKLLTVPVVAEHLDIPHLLVELTPTLTPTQEFPAAGTAARSLGPMINRLTYRAVDLAGAMFRGDIRAARKRLGISDSAALPSPAGTLAAISPTLLPRPADWPRTTHVTGDWHGPVNDQALDAQVQEFVDVDSPFVYAGFGSMAGGDPSSRAEAIVEGARRAGLRVLVATGWGGLEPMQGSLGPDVLVTPSVPHDAVLPRAAVIIHHGGAGTVHAATRAGVPSVVVPFLGDQPFWAAQLRRLGLTGPALQKNRVTPDGVRQAILDATGRRPQVQAAARTMATENGVRTATAWIAATR